MWQLFCPLLTSSCPTNARETKPEKAKRAEPDSGILVFVVMLFVFCQLESEYRGPRHGGPTAPRRCPWSGQFQEVHLESFPKWHVRLQRSLQCGWGPGRRWALPVPKLQLQLCPTDQKGNRGNEEVSNLRDMKRDTPSWGHTCRLLLVLCGPPALAMDRTSSHTIAFTPVCISHAPCVRALLF